MKTPALYLIRWMHTRRITVLLLIVLVGLQVGAEALSGPVHLIPIHGDIDPALVVFVRRSIARARRAGASAIVFDIDTFGGRVDSALQIATLIGNLDPIESIAWITGGEAGTGVSWSAGALISLSTRRIFMAPGTSMGAAAPVEIGASGTAQPASEKEVSAVRAQMAALAEKNGYPTGLALAMVDKDVELLEAVVDGRSTLLTREEVPAAEERARAEGRSFELGVVVSPAGKILSLTAGEMLRYGVSSGMAARLEDLAGTIGVQPGDITREERGPADRLVALITSSAVTTILILVGLVALYLEITTPGFGLPGTVALACFAVVFGANFLLGTVGSLELILLLVGVILLLVEIFLIPGFGVVGISGLVLLALSLVLSMQDFVVPKVAWQWDQLRRNGLVVFGGIVGAAAVLVVLAQFVPRLTPFKRLALGTTLAAEDGFTAQPLTLGSIAVGRRGTALTTLRPVGKAEFDGEVAVVQTEGEFLGAGAPVEVVEVSGNRIVVKGC